MIPKSTLKIPLKNLGLLNKTTFTKKTSRENNQHRPPEKPRIITHIASTATRNFGGQKQLMRSPQANVRPISPLLQPQPLCLRISHPSDISALRRLLITVYQKSGKRLPFGAYFEKNPPERHKKYSALGRKYANIKTPDTKTIRYRRKASGDAANIFHRYFEDLYFLMNSDGEIPIFSLNWRLKKYTLP